MFESEYWWWIAGLLILAASAAIAVLVAHIPIHQAVMG